MALHTFAIGTGAPVVLLHSGGMSGRQWRKLAERLSATHRVVVPDLLGSGENPPWPADAPFHFAQDLAEVATLVADLGAPVHLVGHSYGGLLALLHARAEPATVRSLALFDPVAFGILQDEDDAASFLRDAASLADAADGGTAPWFQRFVDYWNGAGTWTAMPDAARDAFLRVGRKVYLEVHGLLADRTPASAYAVIDAPTLLLTGERTPAAERRVVQRLSRAIANATVVDVEGAGHMGPITHADRVNAAIVAHIVDADG